MRVCTGYEFDGLADQYGFLVLYPNGYRRNWNDCRKHATFPAKLQNIADMSFVRTLIARVMAEQGVDEGSGTPAAVLRDRRLAQCRGSRRAYRFAATSKFRLKFDRLKSPSVAVPEPAEQ